MSSNQSLSDLENEDNPRYFIPFVGSNVSPQELDNMYTTFLEEENERLKKAKRQFLLFKSYFYAMLNSMQDD
jgi:hypothetical protein